MKELIYHSSDMKELVYRLPPFGSVNIFYKREVFGEVEDSSLIMHL